ncbi:epidermal growth factor receptor substrate 15-like 1 isoform X1 [Pimephales promelas]|uniref:epidermal growth factor receptor substrate 15-like 1 isoform X1 n=1 Tax=Pimephales promelas TaxID=90988 RepID=UPI001955C2D2|nr:epidermal growth factor receptor substrate 15-like 1 isoform X1 [Pimephales promelas]KAG1929262.1 epidermal growth factor receptor substrate 15-like [Pimephales promelas]
MAALTPLSQLSSGNPTYESFYRQVDPGNTGKVGAADAAQFLKKSGLSDSTLGQIWDLSDPEGKGYLDKKGFFTALRLVASAQGGSDVSLNSLSQNTPIPKFRDTGSPSLNITTSVADSNWIVKPEDKAKYDGIFESLCPVGGMLSGDKVKPILMNSNLPLDVLGKIWDLSDIDKDGHLDKDEFSVAMRLVYAAREKEPMPSTLPTSLIPPSKRKKFPGALPGSVPVLPSSPFLMMETLRPVPALSKSPLGGSTNLSPSNSMKRSTPTPPQPQTHTQPSSDLWVVPADDREQYEEIFDLADSDFDGMVGGGEVKDIFMNSRLPQSVLAHIWSLADTQRTGKLTKEQFCLAMHLIQEKVKGVDPPQSLSPDMIPPSERGVASTPILSGLTPSLMSELTPLTNLSRDSSSSVGLVELTGNKDLDDINQEISQLQSEKRILETEIRQKEEVLRQKNGEVQEVQRDLERENVGLQDIEHQKRDAQDRLGEMEQQRAKLETTLDETKNKWQEENAKITSLQTQILSQESDVQTQEKEMSRAKTDLYCLEQEEQRLDESLRAGQAKLDSILKLLKTSQDEMDQTRSELVEMQDTQRELNKTIERFSTALNNGTISLAELDQLIAEESSSIDAKEDSLVKSRMAMFSSSSSQGLNADPFQSEDPFKSNPFSKADPFGGDPFKQNDPFKDPFANSDPFGESSSQFKASSFSTRISQTSKSPKPKDSDPFAASDPFSSDFLGGGKGGFADFSQMSKSSTSAPTSRKPTYPLPPPKKPGPQRPAPPPYGKNSSVTNSGSVVHSQGFGAPAVRKTHVDRGPLRSAVNPSTGLADFRAFGSETQQLEWAKRESQREEAERRRRLQLQEQQDLELALALSRAEVPRT